MCMNVYMILIMVVLDIELAIMYTIIYIRLNKNHRQKT